MDNKDKRKGRAQDALVLAGIVAWIAVVYHLADSPGTAAAIVLLPFMGMVAGRALWDAGNYIWRDLLGRGGGR